MKFFFALCFCFAFGSMQAQDTLHFEAGGKVYPDSLVLRWVPANMNVWEHAKTHGIRVERSIYTNNPDDAIRFELLDSALRIQPVAFWKNQFTATDSLAMIAAQLNFGSNRGISNNLDAEALSDAGALSSNAFLFTMMAADRDARVAQALGLRWVDRKYEKGQMYVYRLMLNGLNHSQHTDTAIVLLDSKSLATLKRPPLPECVSGDGTVQLRWQMGAGNPFVGFHLMRKSAAGADKKLNSALIVAPRKADSGWQEYTFVDSIPNYQPHEYYIVGVDGFGDRSLPSAQVRGMARDLSPPLPAQILSVGGTREGAMQVKWRSESVSDGDFKGFYVVRGKAIDGMFEKASELLPAGKFAFIDPNAPRYKGSFYKVLSVDTSGNVSESLPIYGYHIDSLPPAIPVGLKAVIDTQSIVTLTWPAGTEPDLLGYRVYYSNDPSHEFSSLTQKVYSDTVFRDTIARRSLTRHIYYRIAAVDQNMNTSRPSEWVKLKRLDVIPPVQALFKSPVVGDTLVELQWINSSSADVAQLRLEFRKQGETVWKPLRTWAKPDTSSRWVVKGLEKKQWYEFALVCTDSSGFETRSAQPLQVRTYDTGIREGVKNLTAHLDRDGIRLEWSGAFPEGTRYLIYRQVPGSPGWSKYKIVDAMPFVDNALPKIGTYQYTIKVLYKDGGTSIPDDGVRIEKR